MKRYQKLVIGHDWSDKSFTMKQEVNFGGPGIHRGSWKLAHSFKGINLSIPNGSWAWVWQNSSVVPYTKFQQRSPHVQLDVQSSTGTFINSKHTKSPPEPWPKLNRKSAILTFLWFYVQFWQFSHVVFKQTPCDFTWPTWHLGCLLTRLLWWKVFKTFVWISRCGRGMVAILSSWLWHKKCL